MDQKQKTQTHPEQNHDEEKETFTPNGTFLFVILLLTGYALYWAYVWFIVVIEQG